MATKRIHNFGAGPAVLPVPVLEEACENMLSLGDLGMGIMEISHRSKQFSAIIEEAEADLRELLNLPADFHVLFLQGGATLQFSMVPMNLLGPNQTADYIVTGVWSEKAVKEAKKVGEYESRQPQPHPSGSRNQAVEEPGVRSLHVEQHDLRHAMVGRTTGRRQNPGGRCVQRHPVATVGDRQVRGDLRRCPEEPWAFGSCVGHRARRSLVPLLRLSADVSEL